LGARDRLSQKDGEEEKEVKEEAPSSELVIPAGTNPIPILSAYFANNPDAEHCVEAIKDLCVKNQWSDTTLMKYIFAALFPGDDMKTNFYKKTDILALFCSTEKHQKIVFYCLEKTITDHKKLLDQLPHILNGLYEECILDEDIILKWYQNPNKKAEVKFSKDMRDKSKPFVEWLKNAEVVADDS